MKKRLLIVLACMALLTMTMACGSREQGEKPKKTKDGKTIVTMSMMGTDSFYKAAVKKFEQKNPDIEVQLHIYKQPNEKWEENDHDKYVQKINTELLAGSGADILEVASLPVGKYVNKKLFVNLNEFIDKEELLQKGDLYPNIINSMKINDGLYSMPLTFYMLCFISDGNVLKKANVQVDDKNWTWQQFEQVAQQLKQHSSDDGGIRYALANYPPEDLLLEIVSSRYAEFVDSRIQKASFDAPRFIELMEQIKSMYDHQVVTSKEAEIGKQLFYSTMLMSSADFVEWPHTLYSNPVLMHRPHTAEQDSGVNFYAPYQLAISAKSQVQEEAWRFLSFLASEEAQSMQERRGFSVLASVNEKKFSDVQSKVNSGAFKLESGKTVKVADGYFAKAKHLLAAANGYSSGDDKLFSIVKEESKSYFSGRKSAQEAAKLIQNRVTTYLNE
ncbi:extracellular solute-binding protein [Paenibacillus sp. S-12]|uniref:ABC transporter substrate-binding protein n=1 Tax=Paenibacillus sp. S-12 TaxID=3031371 RepID=UPI00259FE77A|nr:extracellular solute-binding protein [Paenibacillus sp. S-12]